MKFILEGEFSSSFSTTHIRRVTHINIVKYRETLKILVILDISAQWKKNKGFGLCMLLQEQTVIQF